jgi:broad specificity phosphatase PhoE
MPKFYFITHPDVIMDPKVPIPRWPLSPRGRARMEKMLLQPWVQDIGAVYCSTEQKAIDGAEILASRISLDYTQMEALGEIDRSSTGFLNPEELRPVVEAFFAHPDQSARGWETATAAQQRIVAAVETVLHNDFSQGDIATISHGAVGTLLLCHLMGVPISINQKQPGTTGGHYLCFEVKSMKLLHGWKRIDPE